MSRKTKQYIRLDALEVDFRESLTVELAKAAADSHSQLFLSSRHNPWPEVAPWTNKRTDQLLESADTILELRKELGEPTDGSLAARFVEYCEEFNNLRNPHRMGVEKHAQGLLVEITSGNVA